MYLNKAKQLTVIKKERKRKKERILVVFQENV